MATIDAELAPPGTRLAPRQNLGATERAISVAAAALASGLAIRQRGASGAALAVIGALLTARGLSGHAPIKRLAGFAPDEKAAAEAAGWSNAALVGRSVTVNAPRQMVYDRFRQIGEWPKFMVNVDRIDVLDDKRSRWVVEAPGGQTVEWTSTITEERSGEFLAWRADEGALVPNTGRIEFRDAPGKRGTEIHATIAYKPPGGALGRAVAKLTQREPGIQLRRDLKRFKSLVETGEISTNEPQGTAPKA